MVLAAWHVARGGGFIMSSPRAAGAAFPRVARDQKPDLVCIVPCPCPEAPQSRPIFPWPTTCHLTC